MGMYRSRRDGGVSWNRIDAGLPDNLWVSRVVASSHVEGRVYATLNGYRWITLMPMSTAARTSDLHGHA